jgi:pyrroline-5-carboxylate reductase
MLKAMPESNDTQTGKILLVGAGRMGGALLSGWLEVGAAGHEICVMDPVPGEDLQKIATAGHITLNPNLDQFSETPPVLTILAVKPQIMDRALEPLAPIAAAGGCFLSVAAGRSIVSIRRGLGVNAPIIRAMPNTPASVARGATVCVAGEGVPSHIRALCTKLLHVVGQVYWMDDESLIDAVTAVSGSGPAYVFHLAECMAEAGIRVGLAPDLARELARLTVAGAGEMLWQGKDDATTLREQVTSPKGTTAAALHVLMGADGLGPLMGRAIEAARDRGRELDRD